MYVAPAFKTDDSAAWALVAARSFGVLTIVNEGWPVAAHVPFHLMRTADGTPVVLDFGLARDLESTAVSLTQSGEMFGTLAYMAPELLLGRTADRRVDVAMMRGLLHAPTRKP